MAAAHLNRTKPIRYKESHIFAVFVPILTTLCMPGLKVLLVLLGFKCVDKWVNEPQSPSFPAKGSKWFTYIYVPWA